MSDTPTPAAAPPITIGPMTNVPAPGSPIRSDWAQQLSNLWNAGRSYLGQTGATTPPASSTVAGWTVNSQPFLMGGSQIVTTDAGGIAKLPFAFAITGGLRACVLTSGDFNVWTGFAARWALDTTGVSYVFYAPNGAARVNATIRVDYIMLGWQAS